MTRSAVVNEHVSFRLPETFVQAYEHRPVRWGFKIGGGNSLGEIIFLTKYSRLKPEGTKERWFECTRRVVEGTFSILREHCRINGRRWDERARAADAAEMFTRLFELRWTPPGRGLWMMGTQFVAEHGSAALQNCAFLSTQGLGSRQHADPFVRLMEMSMLGIGVGFDTLGRDRVVVQQPEGPALVHRVEDSREGWCRSLSILLDAFLVPGRRLPQFEYAAVRPAGSPIFGFGGISAGPEPLRVMHSTIKGLLSNRVGELISSRDIVDIMNVVGRCVASGNVRRSAEIALGDADDEQFLDLKNPARYPDRTGPDGWSHLSNNSVVAEVDGDYGHLIDRITINGEPGLFYRDLARAYGRLGDAPDGRDERASGTNPCGEQTLEDRECCTLVETFPHRHDSLADYLVTLRLALLYAKAVTLVSTHWPDVNSVMERNRRIGCSVSGVVEFAEHRGWSTLGSWLDRGYTHARIVDRRLSSWLGVPESIKLTAVKPSGTVSLLTGATPGAHFPEGAPGHGSVLRRLRCEADGVLSHALSDAGYRLEPDVTDPAGTMVAELPLRGHRIRTAQETTVWEKAEAAVLLQRHWADNQVSTTLTFHEREAKDLPLLMRALAGRLKAVAFLPMVDHAYAQLPYEAIEYDDWHNRWNDVTSIDRDRLYGEPVEPDGELFCTNDGCAR